MRAYIRAYVAASLAGAGASLKDVSMQHATAQNEQPKSSVTLATLPEFPNPQDLQRLLGVAAPGLESLLKSGALPPPVIQSGRIRRWNKAQVLAALGVQK